MQATLVVCCTACSSSGSQGAYLYRSEAFELRADAVVQGNFKARAHSATKITTNYPRAARELVFKFSLNGTENEFPPGQDQMIYLRPHQGRLISPVYKFGVLSPPGVNEPAFGASSEEGPTDVTFRLDLNDVLAKFEADGEYTPPNGETIAAEDFHGVYIMGNTSPLSWNMASLRPGSPLQLNDDDGDGVFELTLTFDAFYNRPLDEGGHAFWAPSEDLSVLPQYRSDQPLVDAIYNMSLEELLQQTRDDGGIEAGARWPKVWTRDVAWGALLAAAAITPDAVRQSLLMKVDMQGRIVQDLGTGGSWPVSTDRVSWAVAAWEVYVVTGDRAWLRRAFDIIKRSTEADLYTAFDAASGLFYGESSFLDWREQSYPGWMQPADIFRSRSLGTNALHYRTYRILARMAVSLGEPADRYHNVADTIRDGMNRLLWQPDRGYYGQFLYGRNYPQLSPRAEALGEAFAVLFGVATGQQKERLVNSMPVVPFGVPSFWPYSPGIPPYHNAGIWPQVGGFWTWAAAEVGNAAAVEHGLATLYRSAALFLTNKENMVATTGHFEGTELNSDRLIGSVGASLATVYRVLLGMRFYEDRLELKPFVPHAYAGHRKLTGFQYRDAVLSIEIEGFGNQVVAAYLDGERLPSAEVPAGLTGEHSLQLTLNDRLPAGELTVVKNINAPETPVVSYSGSSMAWNAVSGAEYYDVYRNGRLSHRTDALRSPVVAGDNLSEYQVAAVAVDQTSSFLSEPLPVVSRSSVEIHPVHSQRGTVPEHGYVTVTPRQYTRVDFLVDVRATACYSVDVHYANGSGPINSGDSAAVRSLLVDDQRAGSIVMPHRGKDKWDAWGYSSALAVRLSEGEHELSIEYSEFDQNMNVERNDARIQHLRLIRLIADEPCAALESTRGEVKGQSRKILLNKDWRFALDRMPEESTGMPAEESWQTVDLPHSWNASDAHDKSRPYYRGTGRYRKSVFFSQRLRGKVLYLYFEGANQVADVLVNGKPAGRHIGGYSAFAVDIGDLVSFGQKNVIDVRVDNRHDDGIPPLNADFTFYGGIYRDVWLLALDKVHFNIDEFAATEFSIDTVSVSEQRAVVEVAAVVANKAGHDRAVQVDSVLVDAGGVVVARNTVSSMLSAESVTRLHLADFDIEGPELWSPESPSLYRVKSTVRDGAVELDEIQYPLGLRWFEVDAQGGFQLNGKPYRLFGTNRHQDYPRLGNALPNRLHRADLEKIKANGFNFLRLAHYPQDPAVLQAADELGLLIWEETPIVNLISQSGTFRSNSVRMVREMVRQHKHHPAIVFWGYMNEVLLREPEPLPDDYYEDVVALARELDDIVKSEDGTRLTVMALSYDELNNGVPLPTVADVLGLNLYFGWYYDTFASLGEFLDSYHEKNPQTPLLVSEYGAGSDERVHSQKPVSFDFSTEFQQRFHKENFQQILDRRWLVGSAVWNQFDFGSNHRQDTKFAVNQKGLWFFDRTPKDIAYYYQAHLSEDPVVHIAVRDWRQRAGSRRADAIMPISVYSNAVSVELLVNGQSLGVKNTEDASAEWTAELVPGENTIVARAGSKEDRAGVYYQDRSVLFGNDAVPDLELAINAGGSEQIVGSNMRIWEADREYVKGSWGYLGGMTTRSHNKIADTEDDPLYQTSRTGPHRYRMDVPDGVYDVELHFAQLSDQGNDGSYLGVNINGVPSSIFVGTPFRRRVKEVRANVVGGVGLSIWFTDETRTAFVNGITVKRASGSTE